MAPSRSKLQSSEYDRWVLVRFVEDDVLYSCPLTRVKNTLNPTVGKQVKVVWKDGHIYQAKVLHVGSRSAVAEHKDRTTSLSSTKAQTSTANFKNRNSAKCTNKKPAVISKLKNSKRQQHFQTPAISEVTKNTNEQCIQTPAISEVTKNANQKCLQTPAISEVTKNANEQCLQTPAISEVTKNINEQCVQTPAISEVTKNTNQKCIQTPAISEVTKNTNEQCIQTPAITEVTKNANQKCLQTPAISEVTKNANEQCLQTPAISEVTKNINEQCIQTSAISEVTKNANQKCIQTPAISEVTKNTNQKCIQTPAISEVTKNTNQKCIQTPAISELKNRTTPKCIETKCIEAPMYATAEVRQGTSQQTDLNPTELQDTDSDSDSHTEDDSLVSEYYPPEFVSSDESIEYASDSNNYEGNTDVADDIPSKENADNSVKQNDKPILVTISKNTQNKRVWDKKNNCVYCMNLYSKLGRHLVTKHENETEVQKILSYPKSSKRRAQLIAELRNKGNYVHNESVRQGNDGQIIPWKRPTHQATADDYLTCEFCLGTFLKTALWRHNKTCTKKVDNSEFPKQSRRSKIQSRSAMLLPIPKEASEGLKLNVLGKMNQDKVAQIVRNDVLILKFGSKLYNQHGHLPHLHSFISQKMRELGRFLEIIRKVDGTVKTLAHCVAPEKFQEVVIGVKTLAGYNSDTNVYSTPSLALKIGQSLKKCALLVKAQGLRELDESLRQKAEKFLALCEMEWASEVSSRALSTLHERKWNTSEILPLVEDIKTLTKYLKNSSKELKQLLEVQPSKTAWEKLSEVTLAQIILFNRRRAGETQRMLIETYENRETASTNEEVSKSLTEMERKLQNSFDRIEIRGKKGRKVPVLLTANVKESIELLNSSRSIANISEENPFIFARTNYGSVDCIRSTDVLRKHARKCGAKHPETLTSTKFRKHIGTVSQILNLKNSQLDQLATFMGHDINVHREFYRLPENTIQLAKISKILVAMDSGQMHKYQGKNLDEIDIAPNSTVSDESYSNSTDDSDIEQEDAGVATTLEVGAVGVARRDDASPSQNSMNECNTSAHEETPMHKKPLPNSKGKKRKLKYKDSSSKTCKKTPWSPEETDAVKKHMAQMIVLQKVPGKRECDECIEKYSVLKNRSWQHVKFHVKNIITAMQRKKSIKKDSAASLKPLSLL